MKTGSMMRFLMIITLAAIANTASGVTLNTLIAGADPLSDDGTTSFMLTDVDGVADDTNLLLFVELAGYANQNSFGFYDLDDPTNVLNVFTGGNVVNDSATVSYLGGGNWQSPIDTATFGSLTSFGLVLNSPEGTFYTNTLLNGDGFDHWLTYNTLGSAGIAGVFDYVAAAEDLYGGGDEDFNDFVVGITDVKPAQPVP